MSKKYSDKTEITKGACFGYYDSDFPDCVENCKVAKACQKASSSFEVKQIRHIAKRKDKEIERLAEKYNN